MVNNTGRKTLNFVILIILVTAVQGTIIFSLTETIRLVISPGIISRSNIQNSIDSYTFGDWAAVEMIQITRNRDASQNSFRNGLLRVFLLSGIFLTNVIFIAKSCNKPLHTDNDSIIKNNTPMKLLI